MSSTSCLYPTAPKQAMKVKTVKSKAENELEEEALTIWALSRRSGNFSVSGEDLKCKMAEIYESNWRREKDATGRDPDRPSTFEPTNGWLQRYQARMGIRDVKMAGESKSADTLAAVKFAHEFATLVSSEGYDRRMVYNMDETGLFWRMLPDRTLSFQAEEKKAKG